MSEQLSVLEPATEQVLAEVARAGPAEVDEAVDAARAALPGLARARPRRARADACARWPTTLAEHREELAVLEARNAGKAIGDARGEMGMVVDTFRYYAGAPERLLGDTIPVAGGQAFTVREPVGVVGLITPWNFPLTIASWKLAPALAAGNTVVLKPAELTPLTALRFAELALEAGLPEGVVNVVVGPGRTLRAAPGRASGRGQDRLHRLDRGRALDRGGRGRDDQAGDARARRQVGQRRSSPTPTWRRPRRGAPMAVFGNAGQDCCARSRILVQEEALDPFLERSRPRSRRCASATRSTRRRRWARSSRPPSATTVASFLDGQAPVAFRGSAPEGAGFWFAPTVLAPVKPRRPRRAGGGVRPDRRRDLLQRRGRGDRLANDSIYGLSGSIWTRDGARALRVARAIETGVLSINANTSVRVTTPFGGFKQSGYGRELGPHALEAYTEVKTIFYATEG